MYRNISLIAIAVTVAILIAHYVICRPRQHASPPGPGKVRRLHILEVLLHAGLIVGFLGLFATGFVPTVGLGKHLHGWLLIAHVGCGPLFIACMALSLLWWAESCCFRLPRRGPVTRDEGSMLTSERFDVTQKTAFWSFMALGFAALLSFILPLAWPMPAESQLVLLQIHRYSGLGLVLTTIVHTYLLVIAKPEGLRVMFTGMVSPEWAKRYHES